MFNCRQADKSTGTQADKSDGQIGRQRQKQINKHAKRNIIDRHAGRETDTNKHLRSSHLGWPAELLGEPADPSITQ